MNDEQAGDRVLDREGQARDQEWSTGVEGGVDAAASWRDPAAGDDLTGGGVAPGDSAGQSGGLDGEEGVDAAASWRDPAAGDELDHRTDRVDKTL